MCAGVSRDGRIIWPLRPRSLPICRLVPGDGAELGKMRNFGADPGAGSGKITTEDLLTISSPNVRLLACKRSRDRRAFIIRVQESAGRRTKATLTVAPPGGKKEAPFCVPLDLRPFEMATLRVDRSGLVQGDILLE